MDAREYTRHFMLLFSGSAGAQLVNLAGYPFLARLYSPEDFGGFAIFVAASAIPAAIACARFELAIPTVRHHSRFAIVWLSYTAAAIIALASGVLGAAYWLSSGTPDAVMLAALLVFAVGITGFCNATTLFLMRHDRYRLTSASIFVRTALAVTAQLAFAFVLRDSRGLVLGYCAGLLAQALLLAVPLASVMAGRRPRARPMRAMFARHRRQVSADILGTLVGAWALHAMPFLIQFLYGPAAVGFYALGQRIAVIPLQLFNDSLSQIFFQKAARSNLLHGTFWKELKFNLLASGAISFAVMVAIMLAAKPVIVIYLGARWEPAATILMIMAPMLAIRSVTMSIATTVFVINKAHWLLLHNVASMAILLLAFGVAAWSGSSLYGFLALLSLLAGVEFAAFGVLLTRAAWRHRGRAAA